MNQERSNIKQQTETDTSVDWNRLITGAMQEEDSCITELYQLSILRVTRAAWKMAAHPLTVQNIIQRAYLWGFRHLDQCPDPEHFTDWMVDNLSVQLKKLHAKGYGRKQPKKTKGSMRIREAQHDF